MSGLFQLKFLLIGVLVVSPSVAAWALREAAPEDVRPQPTVSREAVASTEEPVIHLPVEIVAKGSSPEWVRIEVRTEAVPEPGVVPMVGLPLAWLLLRRRR